MRMHNIMDWLVLWGGIAFFAMVVLYILQKRLIYFVPSALTPRFLSRSNPPLSPPPAHLDAAALDAAVSPTPPQAVLQPHRFFEDTGHGSLPPELLSAPEAAVAQGKEPQSQPFDAPSMQVSLTASAFADLHLPDLHGRGIAQRCAL